jgi:hypothetical protein
MADLLVLIIIAAAGVAGVPGWFFVRLAVRRSAAILTPVLLVGFLVAGCTPPHETTKAASYETDLPGPATSAPPIAPRRPVALPPPSAATPCAAVTPDPACDAAQRAKYLAGLAGRQIRTMPVLVRWRDQLPWERQTPITVVIASSDRAAAQAALDTATVKSGGHVEEKPVAIGQRVRAELTGLNVEIDKPEQTVRDVTALQNVTFEWLVKPTRPGKTVLTLRIFNELITPGGPIELERPALVHEMSVKIGVLDWLTWQMEQMKGLQWAVGGAVFVLGLAFANRARLRRWWRRRQAARPPRP